MDLTGAGLQMDPVAAQDPSYLAFMRGAGYSEAEVVANLARKKGQLSRQLDRSAPRFADELRQAEQGVQQDFTNRGLYRSGARMVGQVDAGNRVRREEQEFRTGIMEQQSDLTAAAMEQIAAGRRGAADQALIGRQQAALNAANAGQGLGAYSAGSAVGAPGNPGSGGPAPAGPTPNRVSDMGKYRGFRNRTLAGRPGTRGPQAR